MSKSRFVDTDEWVTFKIGPDVEFKSYAAPGLVTCHALAFNSDRAGALYHANTGRLDEEILAEIKKFFQEAKVEMKDVKVTIAFSSYPKSLHGSYKEDVGIANKTIQILNQYGFTQSVQVLGRQDCYTLDTRGRQSQFPMPNPDEHASQRPKFG